MISCCFKAVRGCNDRFAFVPFVTLSSLLFCLVFTLSSPFIQSCFYSVSPFYPVLFYSVSLLYVVSLLYHSIFRKEQKTFLTIRGNSHSTPLPLLPFGQ